jgi:hypothetical protein
MKQLFIFIGGMITGALLLFAFAYFTESEEDIQRRKMLEKLSVKIEEIDQKPEVQYIEIKGKKGVVTVHTRMPKDSVQILLGKPDEVSLDTYGGSTHERWGYVITKKYSISKELQMPDLRIEFVDGLLDGVRQD